MSRRASLIAVIVSALCFGTLAVLTPLAYAEGAEPLPLLAWRFAIVALLLAAMVWLRDRSALKLGPGDLRRYAMLALTGYGAASVCFFFALLYAPASTVSVLLYAYPALVTAAGWVLFGKEFRWQQAVAVAMTFLGCALVLGLGSEGAGVRWQGIALGLGAAVGYASFNLLSDRWLKGRSSLTMMTYTFGIAALMPAVGAIATGGVASLSPAGWTPAAWGLLGVIVVVPTFLAIVLYLEGIRGLGPAQAAVVSTLEPVFTIALATVLLPGQPRLGPVQLLGVVLVLAGVAFSEISARSARQPAPA